MKIFNEFNGIVYTSTRRFYGSFSLKSSKKLPQVNLDQSIQPKSPARTRFAPSPTGVIHLGSLRTALYNYLLAKSTGGQFILRLEDTDQTRLAPGSEENIYQSLQWAGLTWDEGPKVGGPYGPYKQSERIKIYSKYCQILLDSGKAYRCFCSKTRLDGLSHSARNLFPPSLASYDRKCTHLSKEESDERAHSLGESFVIRLKSPPRYPQFNDLLHGPIDLQTQVNPFDKRYDDPVLMKSDGFPTYHLANVVDDHLMKITHVIRGEEWLPSTPKHLTLYDAFGWKAPLFAHIPLLTSSSDKKLSKRSGDSGVLSMAQTQKIFPEALINFVALFGWSPVRDSVGVTISEIFSLSDLEKKFSLNGLTKGNAKVDMKKLQYFNTHYFKQRIQDPNNFEDIAHQCYELIQKEIKDISGDRLTKTLVRKDRKSFFFTEKVLSMIKQTLSSPQDFVTRSIFLFNVPEYQSEKSLSARQVLLRHRTDALKILQSLNHKLSAFPENAELDLKQSQIICQELLDENENISKKVIFSAMRYALSGGISGISVPIIITLLSSNVSKARIHYTLSTISQKEHEQIE